MSSNPIPLFSVIVVNWNGGDLLLKCLQALQSQTCQDFEVLLVDNGSADGSADAAVEGFPDARLIRLETNLGFAAANNRAADDARGEWLVLLNNDAFPEAAWLAELRAGIERHPTFSGFASLQLQALNPQMIDGAGDTYHRSGLMWRAGFGQPFGPPWNSEREVFTPCAAAAAYRRDAFQGVGGFDEAFFCYIEDVDLAFRMQLSGHRFMYLPKAVVHHVGSATKGKTSSFARYHGHRNLVWCYAKNMPTSLLWRTLPAHLLLNAVTLVVMLLKGEGAPILRAKFDAMKGLPRVWKQRRKVQASRIATAHDLERRMASGIKSLLRRSGATP